MFHDRKLSNGAICAWTFTLSWTGKTCICHRVKMTFEIIMHYFGKKNYAKLKKIKTPEIHDTLYTYTLEISALLFGGNFHNVWKSIKRYLTHLICSVFLTELNGALLNVFFAKKWYTMNCYNETFAWPGKVELPLMTKIQLDIWISCAPLPSCLPSPKIE